jgi:hypothetical protein
VFCTSMTDVFFQMKAFGRTHLVGFVSRYSQFTFSRWHTPHLCVSLV